MFNIDIHIHFCAQTFLVKYIRDSFTVDENTIGALKMINKFFTLCQIVQFSNVKY